MKKICNKCGKVIGYIERCNCRETKKRLVTQVQKTDKEDLIVKHKRKWGRLREEIIKRAAAFPSILDDRRALIELQHRGILTPEYFEMLKT